jgi:hypothetical protein
MRDTKVRKIAGLGKSEFVNKALVGKDSLIAVHIVGRTKLPIRRAGITTGDAVEVTKPRPSDRITDGDV